MSNVISLPVSDRWLFSVDVFRKPDGTHVARLSDMRASAIRSSEEPRHALLRLASELRDAADGMEQEAHQIGVGDV